MFITKPNVRNSVLYLPLCPISDTKQGKTLLSEAKMCPHEDLPVSNTASRLTKVSKAARRTLLPSSLESSISSGSTTLFVSSVLHNKQQKKTNQFNKLQQELIKNKSWCQALQIIGKIIKTGFLLSRRSQSGWKA